MPRPGGPCGTAGTTKQQRSGARLVAHVESCSEERRERVTMHRTGPSADSADPRSSTRATNKTPGSPRTLADVDASGLSPGKVVTEIRAAVPFWDAEAEHQDDLQRYPGRYLPFPRMDTAARRDRRLKRHESGASANADGIQRNARRIDQPNRP
jgi:hypothetical protein